MRLKSQDKLAGSRRGFALLSAQGLLLAGLSGVVACDDAESAAAGDAQAQVGSDLGGADAAADLGSSIDASPDALTPDAGSVVPEFAPPDDQVPPADAVGGALTAPADPAAPFLTLAAEVDADAYPDLPVGEDLFTAIWSPAPGARTATDGLGPVFHQTSCQACHPGPGRPPTMGANGLVPFGTLIRLARPTVGGTAPDPFYGVQFQPGGTALIEGDHAPVNGEGTVNWETVVVDDPEFTAVQRRSPAVRYRLNLRGGNPPLDADTGVGARLSPHLVGLGLIERVPEAVVLQRADPDDADGDGVSGRARWLGPAEARVLGRFGWKAGQPTVRAQSAAAFAHDMGITSPMFPEDDCTAGQVACLGAPAGGEPELDDAGLTAVADYLSHLAVPAARRVDGDREVGQGAFLFDFVGCTTCHRPALLTGEDPGNPLLSGQVFYPYTDLLLHDMGPALADPALEPGVEAAEWRTPPLWGLGLVELQPVGRFLHDARASSIEDAIRWHGGEATNARRGYDALSRPEQQALLVFLRSL